MEAIISNIDINNNNKYYVRKPANENMIDYYIIKSKKLS